MLKRTMFLALSCLLILGCSGPRKPAKEEIGYGKVKDGVFTHKYFNMSMELPTDWYSQSREEREEKLEKSMQLSGKMFLNDNTRLKQKLAKAKDLETVSLFTLSKHAPNALVFSNPVIMCLAERMHDQAHVNSGSDYLAKGKKMLEKGKVPYQFPEDIYTETISGVSFDIMAIKLSLGPVSIEQKYCATKIKDYILIFILTYNTEEEKTRLMEILNTMKFSK